MKAHTLLHIYAYLAYAASMFLFILAIVSILVGGEFTKVYPDNPFSILGVLAFATPLFCLSWSVFWSGVISAAFADLVKSTIRIDKAA